MPGDDESQTFLPGFETKGLSHRDIADYLSQTFLPGFETWQKKCPGPKRAGASQTFLPGFETRIEES